MDYDDNDFQAQNLHLAGEGSSKFSRVLRPYALPKFDFDDSLQGHLRFDSLVENEVFLGIPSQEDNQWIEDFSRGSSGIEFSSSAAESCSISRRNNVWSEATSSESVEMLLKSVGQEVIVPGETIIEESDAYQELGSLTEQMEPHMKQDDKVKDVMDSDPSLPVLPSDEFLEQFSSLNGVEGASKPQGTGVSIHGSSHGVDPNASSETRGISVTEINTGVDRKCDNENQIEVGNSIDESLDSRLQKDSSGSGVQIDDIDSSSQDVGASVGVLNNREPDNQISNVSFENKDSLLAETGNAVGEHHALGKEFDPDDQFLKGIAFETGSHDMENVTLKAEPIEQRTVETGISTFQEPSNLPSKGGGDLQSAEGCSQDIPSGDPGKDSKCEPVDLPNRREMHQQFEENMHMDLPVVCKGDSKLEGHASDVSNMKAGISSSSELKDDQTHVERSFDVRKDCSRGSDDQLDREASVSNSEASLLSVVDKNVVDGQGDVSGSKYMGDHSSLVVACSLTEPHGYKPSIEILESVDNASEPSTQVKGMQVNNVVVDGLNCNPTARNEPDLSVSLDNTNLASLGRPNAKQVTDYPDNNKKTEDEGSVEENLLLSKESSERENKLGPVLEPEKGASKNSALELSNVPVDQSLSRVETSNLGSGSEQAGESLHSTVGQSLPMTQTFGIASHSGHVVKDNEISENPANKLEVCPTFSDSTIKQDVGVEVPVVPGNHVESDVRKDQDASPKVADALSAAKSGEGRAESSSIPLSESNCNIDQNNREVSDKPISTTPTVISCNVLSQSENEKKEGVKESMDTSIPLSEVAVLPTPLNVSRSNAAKDDGSFRFNVHPSVGLSEKETSKDWSPLPAIRAHKKSTIVEGSPLTPGVGQVDTKMVPELSHGSSPILDANIARGTSKGTTERKTRRASGKATPSSKSTIKENAKKGSRVKETAASRPSEKGDKSSSVSVSFSGTNQLVPLEGLKPYGNVERSGIIPCVVSIPSSSLPDLNTSAPLSALFQQPFTDLQQVQLRAQIFVYGSLIQGASPDEACMFSAFGASDGERSIWEPIWRACVERLQGQKSHPNKSESPVLPLSGTRPPDQSIKQGALQSKLLPLPVSRASSKGTPPPVVNSLISLSSPLWNISTPSCDGLQSSGMLKGSLSDYHQKLSPMHTFQTPPARSFIGHNTSWLSQSGFSGPWVSSPQTSTFDANSHLPVLPMTETVKLTPVKESSAPVSSGIKHLSPSAVVHSTGLGVFAGTSSLPGMKKFAVSSSQNSSDSKARKRKQVPVCENLAQISLLAQTRTQSVSAPVGTSHLSTSIVVSTPACFVSKGNATNIVTIVPPTSSTDHPKKGEQNAEQKVALSVDSFSKVEEAKRQAEVAAALAAAAGSYSQSVWSQLGKQKNSELIADVEAKLSSVAAAVAAAASVAKAAAAAAEVASNAALQAKLMADEALISSGTSNPAQNNATSLSDVVNSFGEATLASILKGGDGSNSSRSFLVAAKEAARRRVEAASAASKHADNLDAIVKAAELAAEAVSQAGKIVAMGDPLPLNSLLEAGPDGYWRVPQVPSEGMMLNNSNIERRKVDSNEGLNVSDVHAKGPKEVKTLHSGLSHLSREITRESSEDCTGAVAGISSSFASSEKDSGVQRSRRAPELSKTIGVVPESEIGSRSASVAAQDEHEKVGSLKENIIKEGSPVEVNKDGDEFKAAWFSANVLSLMDGKAFVCYTELQSDDGSGKLKEWVALEGEGNSPPRIRAARPMTNTRFEGTRKRRRAAMGDYVWSVGDRVDVWIQDCWREGVVTERNKKDDTTLTVRFPAEGQTSVVRTWNLRPTLVWNDGEWIEWSSSTERDPSSQGDTPQEKRLKLGSSATEGRDKANISKTIEQVESGKQDESRLLPLSADDKIFDVGKNTRDMNKPGALRAGRSGLQKEGSRVIFGVPKPGKKRKFMEVSKHYVVESSSKTNESNDSVKFAKYLMPQGSGSRGWKNTKTEAKEKQATVSKTKALKSGKPQSVSGRTLPPKDKFLISAPSAQNEGAETDHVIKDSVSTDENESGQQNTLEFRSVSNTERTAEGPVLFSSLAIPSDVTLKKMSTSDDNSERMNKGKLAPSKEKMAKVELKDKTNDGNSVKPVPEVLEPRRSNRRIQPTSRMLEGLQSSLIISKIPAVSHDKSHRSQIKGTSKGNNHG